MTRPGSRDHGRAPAAARPAAAYTTDPVPADAPVLRCACGCAYRDHPSSRKAHHTVHGHQPTPASKPTDR
jgi:hypothetical protein